MRARKLLWIVPVVVFFLTQTLVAATAAQVDEAVKKAIDNLYAEQKNGHWEVVDAPKTGPGQHDSPEGGQYGGLTAVATYALLSAGEKHNDPRLTPAIDFLRKAKLRGIYAISMRAQVWPLLPPSRENKDAAKRDYDLLIAGMKNKGDAKGQWFYHVDDPKDDRGDHSASQMAVLGLWACGEAGVEIPDNVWTTMDQVWRSHQQPDGGWPYVHNDPGGWGKPTLSMTAAGMATLFLTQDQLKRFNIACSGNAKDPVLAKGFAWIGKELPKDFGGPVTERWYVGGPGRTMYLLYALQRLGVYSGYRYFNTVDWFAAGADYLVKEQRPDGSWGAQTWETSLGLLFMARGRAPVAINKLNYGDSAGWNQRPRDVANLVGWMGKQTERKLNWQIVELAADPLDWLDAPVLYIAGSDELKLTPDQQAKLKAYVEAGGLIAGNADCGNAKFATSFKKLGTTLFASEFRELPAEHVIYTQAFPRKKWKQKIGIQGLSNGVREVMILYADADPAKAWTMRNTSRAELFESMADIYLYNVGTSSMRNKGDTTIVKPDSAITTTKQVTVARLKHAGQWDPEPGGWRRLVGIARNQFKIDLKVETVELGQDKLSATSHPIAHITGVTELPLTDAARAELKQYIDAGGQLLIDAAGGKSAFTVAVEQQLEKILPGEKLVPITNDTRIALRPFARTTNGLMSAPRLIGIQRGGKTAVIYSPLDLTTGLVGTQVDGVNGYDPASSAALMMNLLGAGNAPIAVAAAQAVTEPAPANGANPQPEEKPAAPDLTGAKVEAVAVGKGSYASSPPPGVSKGADAMRNRREWFVVDLNDRPIPTNQWWTHLLTKGTKSDLWVYPHNVETDPKGVRIQFPTEWKGDGKVVTTSPLKITAKDFSPANVKAKDWTDWTLTFRLADGAKHIDYTVGEGLPYVWIEANGVSPGIECDSGKTPNVFAKGPDHIGFELDGRNYGVFLPDGAKYSVDGKTINIDYGGKTWLVICPLSKPEDLATFRKHAFAVPRKAEVSWSYDPKAGAVSTTWEITTEPLKGTEKRLIQGWIPHHYRKTTNDLKFTDITYRTPRGMMKTAVGNTFKITWPFGGFAPLLPAPKPQGGAHDFNADRMKTWLEMASTKTKYGADTYWGAKDFLQQSHYMEMAYQLNDPSAAKLQENLKRSLVDWFTYEPGEKEHFFARYDNWKGMVGLKGSYGSEEFTDNHFHYGYFTFAASKLAMVDPEFKKDFGPMARLVAKQYANWDRADKNFPLFRTSDLWAGHSWAGGQGSPGGANQESSSEAVQGWIGLFQLGSVLEDDAMIAAGAMGYAMETQATMEYWFNAGGDVFPPTYSHPIIGMVWSGGQVYGTYFSGDPAWIFAIQWLPWSPGLAYLAEDKEFAKKLFETMMAERRRKEKKPEIETTGSGLGNVLMTYAAMYDPDWVAAQLDEFYEKKNPIQKDNDTGGMTYYWTHAARTIGDRQFNFRLSVPTSAVYRHPETNVLTYIVYNPKSTEQKADVYRDGKQVGTITLPPLKLTVVNQISP
jgi:endoglucanase Acf2